MDDNSHRVQSFSSNASQPISSASPKMDDDSLRFQMFPSDAIQRTAVRPRKWTTIHFELRSSLRLQFKLNTASSKMKHNSLPSQTFSSDVIHRTVLRPSKWTTIHFGFSSDAIEHKHCVPENGRSL